MLSSTLLFLVQPPSLFTYTAVIPLVRPTLVFNLVRVLEGIVVVGYYGSFYDTRTHTGDTVTINIAVLRLLGECVNYGTPGLKIWKFLNYDSGVRPTY